MAKKGGRWGDKGTKGDYISICLLDTSLSITCFLGDMPARFSRNIRELYALIILASFWLLIGSTRMALLSISTMIIIYLLPLLDLV